MNLGATGQLKLVAHQTAEKEHTTVMEEMTDAAKRPPAPPWAPARAARSLATRCLARAHEGPSGWCCFARTDEVYLRSEQIERGRAEARDRSAGRDQKLTPDGFGRET